MKSFIVFALFVAAAVALPTGNDAQAETVEQNNDNIGTGPFRYGFKTSNGQSVEAEGQLVDPGTENEAVVIRGSYSYIGDDGKEYSVVYVADKDGFHPQGSHLPVGPQ